MKTLILNRDIDTASIVSTSVVSHVSYVPDAMPGSLEQRDKQDPVIVMEIII